MSTVDRPTAKPTAIHRRVEALRRGLEPGCIARLESGWAVFGERQFLRGYALLLPDPVVPTLNDLPPAARVQFLADMARLGDALLAVTGALRINYAMFGNLEPALHAHVVPRYREEPSPLDVAHPWAYDWSSAPIFDAERERDLLSAVRAALSV
ncbi:MAG: HIT family protein [Steroidobacteraceae bacterium]|jgi:diadenosine tetraphosphate (Ap4A) HIT family hydrolase